MDYVASLDIGNERMTMALGEREEDDFRLLAVEVEDAGGVKDGRLTDKERAKEGVRHLLERFKREHRMNIDSLNVALPDALSRRVERKETESFPPNRHAQMLSAPRAVHTTGLTRRAPNIATERDTGKREPPAERRRLEIGAGMPPDCLGHR